MFAFAKFKIITGTVRALCLSCGKEGIVKNCLIICVCINVEILVRLLCVLGRECNHESSWELMQARKASPVNVLGACYWRHLR